jgi:16S rRNA (adenine1518-N6/adenine1519-N6)-dimethyltransferase
VPLLTPSSVRALLDRHDVRPSAALGQHFLADPNTARRIVRLAGVEPGDRVLEIGPGLGSLTLALLDAGAHVVALELDRHVVPALRDALDETSGDAADVRIEVGDALDIEFGELLDGEDWIVVSNLPYNIATPVVVRVLETAPQVSRLLVMVQREVGERLAAGPGSKTYGAVSVKIAFYSEADVVGVVPPTVFVPTPKVDSALVRLQRRPFAPVDVPSRERLFTLVQAGFAQRRKMLRQSLRPVLGAEASDVLERAGIPTSARAESLGLEDWAALARAEAVAA